MDIPEIGTENSFGIKLNYKPSNQTDFGICFDYEDVSDYYHGFLLKSSVKHAFSSNLSLRTKIQYSDYSNTWFIYWNEIV